MFCTYGRVGLLAGGAGQILALSKCAAFEQIMNETGRPFEGGKL